MQKLWFQSECPTVLTRDSSHRGWKREAISRLRSENSDPIEKVAFNDLLEVIEQSKYYKQFAIFLQLSLQ